MNFFQALAACYEAQGPSIQRRALNGAITQVRFLDGTFQYRTVPGDWKPFYPFTGIDLEWTLTPKTYTYLEALQAVRTGKTLHVVNFRPHWLLTWDGTTVFYGAINDKLPGRDIPIQATEQEWQEYQNHYSVEVTINGGVARTSVER